MRIVQLGRRAFENKKTVAARLKYVYCPACGKYGEGKTRAVEMVANHRNRCIGTTDHLQDIPRKKELPKWELGLTFVVLYEEVTGRRGIPNSNCALPDNWEYVKRTGVIVEGVKDAKKRRSRQTLR